METPFENLHTYVADKAAAEEKAAKELAALKEAGVKPAQYFAQVENALIDKAGGELPASSLEGKVIGLYFSAHWSVYHSSCILYPINYNWLVTYGCYYYYVPIPGARLAEDSLLSWQ